MPNNENIQNEALFREELLNLFKEKYRLMFLEKLGSVDSVLTAIEGRYKGYEQKEAMKDVFKKLFDEESISEEKIIQTIKELAQDPNGTELYRFEHFFGDKNNSDSRDQELSSRTRFILDAVCFNVTADFEPWLNEFIFAESVPDEILHKWHLFLSDFNGYIEYYKDKVASGGYEEGYLHLPTIQACIMAKITDYVDQCVRNPLLGARIKREENSSVSIQDGEVEAKDDGFVPMIDNDLISMNEGRINISSNILAAWMQKNEPPSSEEIEIKTAELDKKINELFPGNFQEIRDKAHKAPANQSQHQKPASKSGSKTRLAVEAGGILASVSAGAGAGALLGTFAFPVVGTALGAFAGSVFGLTAGVAGVGLGRGLSNSPLFGNVLAIFGSTGLGTSVGALLGTFVPGLGTVIGAGIGAAIGFTAVVAPLMMAGIGVGLSRLFKSLRAGNSSKEEGLVVSSPNIVQSSPNSHAKMNDLGLEPSKKKVEQVEQVERFAKGTLQVVAKPASLPEDDLDDNENTTSPDYSARAG